MSFFIHFPSFLHLWKQQSPRLVPRFIRTFDYVRRRYPQHGTFQIVQNYVVNNHEIKCPVLGSGTHRPVRTADRMSCCEERFVLRRCDSSRGLEEHLGAEEEGYFWQRHLDMHKINMQKRAREETDQSEVLVRWRIWGGNARRPDHEAPSLSHGAWAFANWRWLFENQRTVTSQ